MSTGAFGTVLKAMTMKKGHEIREAAENASMDMRE